MATIQQLLQSQKQGRVQVGDLPDAPGLQPTIRSGGQYTVRTQQAPESKLSKLAKGLSHINPALRDYAVGVTLRDEGLMKEGHLSYMEDPEGTEKQIEAWRAKKNETKQGIRKLINSGFLPEEANAVRMLGALKAKASAMVLDDYRAEVMAGINDTTDVEEFLGEKRKAFLENPYLDSQIVKKHAIDEMFKVDNEFRNVVHNRQLKFEIEQGKKDWLRTGDDLFTHAIAGRADLSEPEFKEFINHEAGLFAGSNFFVFDKLIKRKLLDGLLTVGPNGKSVYSPTQVKNFLTKLKEWKISDKGAKFADAEIGNAINAFTYQVDNISDMVENRNFAAATLEKDKLIGAAFDLFHDEFRTTGAVSVSTYNDTVNEVMGKVPPQHRNEVATKLLTFFKTQNGMLKDSESLLSPQRYGELVDEIDDGVDLASAEKNLKDALQKGFIRDSQYDTLLKRINDSRDFSENVLKLESYAATADNYGNLITGWKKTGRGVMATFQDTKSSFFKNTFLHDKHLIANKGDPRIFGSVRDWKRHDLTLFGVVKHKHPLGEAGVEHFVNNQNNVFQQMFKDALRRRFTEWEKDDKMSPEDARERIRSEMEQISADTFTEWEKQVIQKIKDDFKVNFELAN